MGQMSQMTESMKEHHRHDEVRQKIRSVIPEDLIYEIMLRLPARSMGRFRCVSKSWLSITTRPSFIAAHLQHKRLAHQTLMIVDPNHMKPRSTTRLYLPSFDANTNARINLRELPPLKIRRPGHLEYSCDGLVLLQIPMKGNYIINPLTGHSCLLPRSRITDFLAIYFHRPTSKYRLLADLDANSSCVLVIGTTKWRRIHGRLPAMALTDSFVDVSESLYCLAKMDPTVEDGVYPLSIYPLNAPPNIVMTFHKETEVYNSLPLPPSEELIGRGGGSLMNFNGELGLWFVGDNGIIDFWIMKECWIKRYSVHHPDLENRSKYISYEWNVGFAVSVKDEELLIGAFRGVRQQQLLVRWNLKTGACLVQNLKDCSPKLLIQCPYIEALTSI